jgi:hypothetical protein
MVGIFKIKWRPTRTYSPYSCENGFAKLANIGFDTSKFWCGEDVVLSALCVSTIIKIAISFMEVRVNKVYVHKTSEATS